MLNKLLAFYTKFFAVWVMLLAIVAYYWPEPFKVNMIVLNVFFGLTMFGIGAVLSVDDFRRIGQRPVIILIGSAAQFTIMPLGAYFLARLFNLPPVLAAGLILAGCAPGAMASNVMCYVGRADTAYSVSLTTVSTLLCPVLTPGLTVLLAQRDMDIPFWPMFLDVMCTVVLPLLAGFATRHFFRKQVDRVSRIFPAISVTFIIFICAVVIALNRERLQLLTPAVIAVVVCLNVYGMFSGYGVGTLFGMETARRRTLSIEIGMQNAGLGTKLALAHLGSESAIPTALFVFVCIITASVMVEFWRRQSEQKSRDQSVTQTAQDS
ncbi:MAG: bile acid:sodium symporter family protein [Planctomycetes bacterium]|nr:bile acid:sodium symporter family protein [Planctomycetota bacterium]